MRLRRTFKCSMLSEAIDSTQRLSGSSLSTERGDRATGNPLLSGERPALRRPLLLTFGSILEPDGGLQVRTRLLAEHLAELGLPPAVVSTREDRAILRPPPWARSFTVPRSASRRQFFADLVCLTRRAASGSSLVIISDATLLPVLTAAKVGLPLVWDTNECQSLHYGRLPWTPVNRAKRVAWLGLERWAGHRCSLAVAIGDSEAAHWKRIHPEFSSKVVTVDHAPFARQAAAPESRAALERHLGRSVGAVLVFVGTMKAKHNVPAARWIIDVLAPSLPPTATVVLCGTGTDNLRGRVGGAPVECLGQVDDVDSVIASADVCLAPLTSGAGVKTKVLHYLAHCRRVAGTPLAFEGLDGAPGIFEAPLESLPALVAELVERGESREAAQQRAAAQTAWMERHHGRRHVATQWQEILQCLNPA